MKNYNILVFPCGTEIANEIFRSLKNHKYFKLVAATSVDNSYCKFRDIKIYKLPFVDNDQFLDELHHLISGENINFIIPAHDDVAYKLSKVCNQIDAEIIGQDYSINKIVRFKDKTYNFFEDKLPVPKYREDPQNIKNYPLFVKPQKGQGSQNSFKLNNVDDYNTFKNHYNQKDFVIMEYLPGREFTIDCFSDSGNVLYFGARTREKTIKGISVKSSLVTDDKLNKQFSKYADIISGKLNLHGIWFFQMKYGKDAKLKLLEIGPRVSGTMMLNRARGVNFVELALYQKLDYDVEIKHNKINISVGRALEPVYKHDLQFNELFIDFDDTLLLEEKYINPELMKLIFQVKNDNKNVYLITRHTKNLLEKILKKYGITDVFDKIIHLQKEENKSKFMNEKSLLIDDSFRERREVINSGAYAVGIDNIKMFLRE